MKAKIELGMRRTGRLAAAAALVFAGFDVAGAQVVGRPRALSELLSAGGVEELPAVAEPKAAPAAVPQDEESVPLMGLRPGTKVTFSKGLSESIASDDRGFSASSFCNGVKIEGLLDSIRAAARGGPGLLATVKTVPGAAFGECEVPPAENVLTIVGVRLSGGSGKDARLILDFTGLSCIKSITLQALEGASQPSDLSRTSVTDIEETFGVGDSGVPRLKVDAPGPWNCQSLSGKPGEQLCMRRPSHEDLRGLFPR